MYLTSNNDMDFDWDVYFENYVNGNVVPVIDHVQFYMNTRKALGENNRLISFSLCKALRRVLKGIPVQSPDILELGAGTGFLSRSMLTMYGGKSTMVDNCESSYKKFQETIAGGKEIINQIDYIVDDLFGVELNKKFDIVCSFGVVEHFADKKDVLLVHKKYTNDEGYSIIIVPYDSILTRLYYNTFVEVNLGYRELLTEEEILKEIKNSGLKPVRWDICHDYVYDFITVLCK